MQSNENRKNIIDKNLMKISIYLHRSAVFSDIALLWSVELSKFIYTDCKLQTN